MSTTKPADRGRPIDLASLRTALEQAERGCDIQARLAVDPVGIVRRFRRPDEIELVGLLASCLAFGNVKALRASIERVLALIGPDVCEALEQPALVRQALTGFRHRMVQGDEIGRVLVGARRMQTAHGSLGGSFAGHFAEKGTLRGALSGWVAEVRREGGLASLDAQERRGPAHVLPDPDKASGCKRLLLYLRWMVRPDDGVDLGLWTPLVSPSILQIPVDTHIHRLGLNLGMTRCASPSWRASEEITNVLRLVAPDDPVRYDFALCHLGMARACTSRFDDRHCGACAIRGACIHLGDGPIARRTRPGSSAQSEFRQDARRDRRSRS